MKNNLASEKKSLRELQLQMQEQEPAEPAVDLDSLSKKERRKYERQQERETFKELSFFRKIQYILNYYGIKIGVGLVAVGAVIFLIRQVYIITCPVALDIVFVNTNVSSDYQEIVENLWRSTYDVPDRALFEFAEIEDFDVNATASYTELSYYNLLMADITGNTTQIIVCDKSIVDYYVEENPYMVELYYNLPPDLFEAFKEKDRLYWYEDGPIEDSKYYAIDISGMKITEILGMDCEDPYIFIPCTLDEENLQIAYNFLYMILDLEDAQ